ncbi:MAG: hypothetical protein H6805_10105 [Planctomycetes bacterium]|nr:hypothetical protein [Planctomycetota bacterium]
MRSLVLLLAFVAPLAACGGGGGGSAAAPDIEAPPAQPGPVDPPADPQAASLAGHWLLESGSMLPTFIKGLATWTTTTDVTALTVGADGLAKVWFRDRLTDAITSLRAFVLYDGETIVLDFSAEPTSDVASNIDIEQYMFLFPYVVVQEDALGVADEDGRIALFSRQTELPEDVVAGQLQVLEEHDDVPRPQFFTDLVLYNNDLVYASDQGFLERFDPGTGLLLSPLANTQSRLPQTVQGSHFWTHCGCGGSRDAYRRSLGTVYDTVSSESEMGGPITFRAMAYVPNTDRLWLHGRAFDDQFGRFYVMNTLSEPDVVETTVPFNRDLRALAVDGAFFWGLITVGSQAVVLIDPTTGRVTASYEVPDENVSWNGLVVVGNDLWLVGTDLLGGGRLVRVAQPD